jgi:hypothetical protein
VTWACVLACLLGCDRETETAAHPPASASTAQPDTTLPGEIAEGAEQAFGLPLPRDMQVTARLKDAVYANGKLPFEPLANYVRDRVLAERVDTGPNKTVFVNAAVKSSPTKLVDVEVVSRHGSVQMVVRDRHRPPPEPGLSEEERWKRAGLTPKGKVIKTEAK